MFAEILLLILIWYAVYFSWFFFSLIPIFSQIFFLKFFKFKNSKMIYIIIFLIEGFIIALASMITDLPFMNTDLPFMRTTLPIIITLLLLIIIISYFLGKRENKVNFKKTIIIIFSFLLNTFIVFILTVNFGLFLPR